MGRGYYLETVIGTFPPIDGISKANQFRFLEAYQSASGENENGSWILGVLDICFSLDIGGSMLDVGRSFFRHGTHVICICLEEEVTFMAHRRWGRGEMHG